MKRISAVMFLAGMSLACLNDENRHAFYLEPDGAATWSVTQEDIRTDSAEPARTDGIEAEYLGRARHGDLEIARALRELGGTSVETRIVRDRPPFTIVTEAEFESAAWMIEEFLTRVGLEAEAELRFHDGRTCLYFRFNEFRLEGADAAGEDDLEDEAVMPLVESVEAYRFVLTEGRFLEATGFRLDGSRTTAVMIDPDELAPETSRSGESYSYSLTWTGARRSER